MKLKEYIEQLKNLVDLNPDINNYDVIYSIDDEGNYYNLIHLSPSIGLYDHVSHDFYCSSDITDDNNAVCIN